MESTDETQTNEVRCLCCQKLIEGKPWIIVEKDSMVYGCSYRCGIQFKTLIGNNYWDDVVNKEDFNEPRPVYGYTNRQSTKDITTGFGMTEIRDEITKEEIRIQMIEDEYENDSVSDDSDFDEVNL